MGREQYDESDLDESAFDEPGTEPVDRLPALGLGKYTLHVDNTVRRKGPKGEFFIVELTVKDAVEGSTTAVGSRASYMIKLDVTGFAKKYMARRVKGFVYTATARRKIEGRELKGMLDDSTLFIGKVLEAEVKPQLDDEGEVKQSDEGKVYTETVWSSTAA